MGRHGARTWMKSTRPTASRATSDCEAWAILPVTAAAAMATITKISKAM